VTPTSHRIDATNLLATPSHRFELGSARRPDGLEIEVTSNSLVRNGRPWLAVMGEFHYSRCPAGEWRRELLKMKAGGIDIAATYVFWIHHEQVQGKWDWAGRRSLREFVKRCGEVDLPIVVRCGPWCHGEVRNGGFPDWVQAMGRRTRSDDPEYLAHVKRLYEEIAGQLQGLLWKDGGPVIGIQLDNEYGGPAEHLLTLKSMARQAGLDVPLYTRTGWPNLATVMPFGEILPLYGAYAEGFWDRSIAPMPGRYWHAFAFTSLRTDVNIGADQLGAREAEDAADALQYPYLTCELGGGMPSSYHRRIQIEPRDVYSVALVKIGSGSNLPGYYMYHGGTNPTADLNETQASGYHNDLPAMTYDFQAPLGEFGQVRPHYHLLRRLHLFLRDWEPLAGMRAAFPSQRPSSGSDAHTLRWSVRTDGSGGFVFVNNYQRLLPMPAKPDVQFDISLKHGIVRFPFEPITIPADSSFLWPFHMDLGGVRLVYATAQPMCRFDHERTDYFVFAQTAGVPSEFVFGSGVTVESTSGVETRIDGQIRIMQPATGAEPSIQLRTNDGRRIAIIVLDEPTSLGCWKLGARVILSRANLFLDGKTLHICAAKPEDLGVQILPFARTRHEATAAAPMEVVAELIRDAGPARTVRMGSHGVAEQPDDSNYAHAALWRIRLPQDTDPGRDLLLRIRYIGDVARLELDGKLLADNFYNGDVFEVGLKRFAPDIYRGELILWILPMPGDAPIYLSHAQPPDGVLVAGVDVVETFEREVQLPPVR
jgi:hypothetical protein